MLPQSALEHDYSVWKPDSTATFCNVPWDSSYRDIVKYNSSKELDEYINKLSSQSIIIERLTVLPPNQPIRINVPHNVIQHYNYVRVVNKPHAFGDKEFPFYYFISNLTYISPSVTQVDIQLDVWATYQYYVKFGESFVVRGHVGLANDYSKLNQVAVPEGLDMGGEYETVYQVRHDISSYHPGKSELHPWYCIVATADLTANPGSVEDPNLETSRASQLGNGVFVGADIWYMDGNNFLNFLVYGSKYPWITQSIMSCVMVPRLKPAAPKWQKRNLIGTNVEAWQPGLTNIKDVDGISIREDFVGKIMLQKDVEEQFQRRTLPAYNHLRKLFTYPYSVIEITTYTGAPLIIKPEQLDKDRVEVIESVSPVPPSPRMTYYIADYNTREWDQNQDKTFDRGEYMDMGTGIFNLPQLPITNNSYLSYMAANTHSINFQYSSADWSQQKALRGNQLADTQAASAIGASNEMNNQSISAMNAMNSVANDQAWGHQQTSLATGGFSVLGNALTGNFGGAINNAASMAAGYRNYDIDKTARDSSNSISTGLSAAQQQVRNEQAHFVRDTNRQYADYAAKGDYSNAIAGIQAKTQDAKMLQPSVSGQLGGDFSQIYNFKWAVHVKFKMLTEPAMKRIGDYWLRFGYETERFVKIPESLMTMKKFTYWQLQQTYLTGNIAEIFKNAIRGIFEKGVTVWADPSEIGTDVKHVNEPYFRKYF